jgi:hypothetical protein
MRRDPRESASSAAQMRDTTDHPSGSVEPTNACFETMAAVYGLKE